MGSRVWLVGAGVVAIAAAAWFFAPRDEGVNEAPAAEVFVSPTEGEKVVFTALQVHVGLPDLVDQDSVRLTLDGKPWADPMRELRWRNENRGGGHLMLAELDVRPLKEGPHQLVATFDTVRANGDVVHWRSKRIFQVAHPGHRVDIRVTNEAGKPVDARVFVRADGDVVKYDGLNSAADKKGRDRKFSNQFAIGGEHTLWLKPGGYRITAVRGVRDEIASVRVELSKDQPLDLTLKHAVTTPGWVGADLHVHTNRSIDSVIPHRSRFASIAAAGLEAVVITDHNKAWDAQPIYDALGAASRMMVVPGNEVNIHAKGPGRSIGHLNVFPMLDAENSKTRDDEPLAPGLARLRDGFPASGGGWTGPQILQLNHPRGIQFRLFSKPVAGSHALFSHMGFKRDKPIGKSPNKWMTPESLDYDALELVNRFSWALYLTTRLDWYELWRQGYTMTGTGNSDSHALHVELAGLPTNLIHVGAYPDMKPRDAFHQAIKDGRVSVSTGPVVELQVVSATGKGGPGDTVVGKEVTARVRVRAPSWVPVPEVRLMVNGRLAHTAKLEPTGLIRGEFEWPLELRKDSFITAEASYPLDHRGKMPEPYASVAPGYVPLAFTNPVRVDQDGNGEWVPPGLFE